MWGHVFEPGHVGRGGFSHHPPGGHVCTALGQGGFQLTFALIVIKLLGA